MLSRVENAHLQRTEYSKKFITKLFRCLFIFSYFHVRLVLSNKDIPVCHKLWNDLGNEMQDWRGQCLEGDEEKSCREEKEYFEKRRRNHKKMCFYEGER